MSVVNGFFFSRFAYFSQLVLCFTEPTENPLELNSNPEHVPAAAVGTGVFQDVQQRLSQLSRFLGLEAQVEVVGTKGHATYERLRDLVISGDVGFVFGRSGVCNEAVSICLLSPFVYLQKLDKQYRGAGLKALKLQLIDEKGSKLKLHSSVREASVLLARLCES
jgi:hypothetical protein